jgi:hypothetical protein
MNFLPVCSMRSRTPRAPEWSVPLRETATGRLRIVLPEFGPPSVPIHVVHAEGRKPSAKVRAFARGWRRRGAELRRVTELVCGARIEHAPELAEGATTGAQSPP